MCMCVCVELKEEKVLCVERKRCMGGVKRGSLCFAKVKVQVSIGNC